MLFPFTAENGGSAGPASGSGQAGGKQRKTASNPVRTAAGALGALVLGLSLALAPAQNASAAPTVYPTGTVRYNPDKAYGGWLLIGTHKPILVDMNGNLVKEWPGFTGFPNKALPGGKIMTSTGVWKDGQQDQLDLVVADSDGKILWQFRRGDLVPAIKGQPEENGKTWVLRQHHDYQRKGVPPYPVPGQTDGEGSETLILAHVNERDARISPDHQLVSDILYEVSAAGDILWTWRPAEHLAEMGFDETALKAMRTYPPVDNPTASRHAGSPKPGGGFDWLHLNCASYIGPNHWFDEDPAKYAAFNPDNILVNSRDGNVMFIIERATDKVVWRLGPNFAPGTEDAKVGQISGAHGAHIIPKGLPGAGNLLFFDNGGPGGYGEPNRVAPVTGFHNVRRDFSRVVEFNPATREIVWSYDWYRNHKGLAGHFGFRFYSPFVSYAQRLPNGNTMVTEGNMGRVFELTPAYEEVWEYMSPYLLDMPLYRTYRVPYDFFPQLPKPEEVSVTPPDRASFHLPNDRGEMPRTGTAGK